MQENRTAARLRFAALYAIGLCLTALVVSAFWRKNGGTGNGSSATEAVPSAEKEQAFMRYDLLLHQRMDRLDGQYAEYIRGLQSNNQTDLSGFLSAKTAFGRTLDSLDQLSPSLPGTERDVVRGLTRRYRRAYTTRYNLVSELGGLPAAAASLRGGTTEKPALSNAEIEELKRMLSEKDERILALEKSQARPASGAGNEQVAQLTKQLAAKEQTITALQGQLQQKDAALKSAAANTAKTPPPVSTGDGSDWKQKYSSLKSAHDKVLASEKSLKSAYKTVADDNRRLLGQLQSIRKE